MTQIFVNYQANSIRLTDERLEHILDHPEMVELVTQIEVVLKKPQIVRQSSRVSTIN